MAEYAGWQRYIHVASETQFGTTPGSPTYVYVPVSQYDVGVQRNNRQSELFTGRRQQTKNQLVNRSLQGTLAAPLFGHHAGGQSIAQFFIDKALSAPSGLELDSFLAEISEEGTDDKRHNGLRVNSCQISGQAEGGDITMSLDLIGKDETGGITVQSLSDTSDEPDAFLFADATLSLDADGVGGSSPEDFDFISFQIDIQNNLKPYFVNSKVIEKLPAMQRLVRLTFQIFKIDDTFDALNRSNDDLEYSIELALRGKHGGSASGTYTTATFTFDRIPLETLSMQSSVNELATLSTNWLALKPLSSSNELDVTWSTE
ncbi:hypothetical protein Pan216_08390 [Planctomycetes bacterium Pan216]|uniref:Uncharacterized protein n=1 Tax=Kolteria novifilia TaxID=2527975 RepID=A0A518AZ78_9BACT|nr:hypothetical protein Pan216_08390 [Planctomycetes bacterium Pan216]